MRSPNLAEVGLKQLQLAAIGLKLHVVGAVQVNLWFQIVAKWGCGLDLWPQCRDREWLTLSPYTDFLNPNHIPEVDI